MQRTELAALTATTDTAHADLDPPDQDTGAFCPSCRAASDRQIWDSGTGNALPGLGTSIELEGGGRESMSVSPSPGEIRETLRALRSTTPYFKRTATGLTDAELRRPPDEGSWSVHEVLAHLRGCADVQGAWIARMLAEDTPTIRYASPRTGMQKTDYVTQDFQVFLRAFSRQRTDLLKTLTSLDVADWARGATFTGTTRGWTPTVLALASGLATHEQAHFKQIAAAADASR